MAHVNMRREIKTKLYPLAVYLLELTIFSLFLNSSERPSKLTKKKIVEAEESKKRSNNDVDEGPHKRGRGLGENPNGLTNSLSTGELHTIESELDTLKG